MDPDENLREQLRLASRLVEGAENGRPVRVVDSQRLAELVIALDEWIKKGGFLPAEWLTRST